jgi:hypothetical protein
MVASAVADGPCAGPWRGWCASGPAVVVAPARRGLLAPRRVLPGGEWQVTPDSAGPGPDPVPTRQGRAPVCVWGTTSSVGRRLRLARRGYGWRGDDGDGLCHRRSWLGATASGRSGL